MKYPFVKQEGTKDCAVATLSMIIKYYKGYIANDQLYDMLKTSKEGTSAFNIIKVAEYIGFKSKAIKTEKIDELKLPCIAYVTIDSRINHFIVIYEINIKKNTILIADPATCLKKMSLDEFNKISNNIYILFYKIKNIPYFKSNSVVIFIKDFLKNNKNPIVKISLLSLFINTLIIILSFSFNTFLSSISYDYRLKYLFLIIFVALALFKVVITYLRNLLTIYLNNKISYELTNELYKKIIHFPYIYYCNRTTGEIISRITDLEQVKSFISKIIIILFSNIPLIIISLIAMFSLSTNLTIYTLLFLILYGVIVVIYRRVFKYKIKDYQLNREKNTSFLVESINAYECIKGLGIENEIIRKFKSLNYEYLNKILSLSRTINSSLTFKDLINEISSVLIMFLGIIGIEKGVLSVGTLITFTFLLSNFTNPIKEILDSNYEFEESINTLKRVLELDYKSENKGVIKKLDKYDIKISNLTYSYDDTILKNVTLKINEGERVMLVGESGSGKSTLLKVIKKYLKVKNDMVSIGGIDINNYNDDAFGQVSYISQNEMLFTDSLYQNANLYRELKPREVINSLSLTKADKIIKNDLGLNSLIEENGFNLSGGEKQRIILARALLNESKIILIDEGTNQLDVSLERVILKNIFEKHKNKTIIVISHRMNNLDLFNHLIRLEKGVVTEDVLYGK